MKRLGFFILIVGLFWGCTSSKELLQKGRYDQAIRKSAEALREEPKNTEELFVLQEAYTKANIFDKERISFLKMENRDGNWLEIYHLYTQLRNRQAIIRSLPPSVRTQFTLVDYNEEIIQSKKSAAEASYQKGLEYLDRGYRESARLAWQEFVEVTNIYPDYKNVRQLMAEAKYLGTNFILLRVENNSESVLPADFSNALRKVSFANLNSQWVQYETNPDSTVQYDYAVIVNIQDLQISPATIEKRSYTETKEIQDGLKYVFDANGNVKKDSLGNDIKVPNMITVSAEITESVQHKAARVGGSIDYINLNTNQLVKTDNISVNAIFEHFSAVAVGHEEALSEESQQKVTNRPLPFPSNEMMLMDAAQLLKTKAKAIIYRNRELLAY
jgi:tetratricopeptide (TPR) repeat protein